MILDPPRFLDELCVKLGICLDPDARSTISTTRHRDVDAVEEAVLAAERIDPLTASRRLRHDLRELITRHWVTTAR